MPAGIRPKVSADLRVADQEADCLGAFESRFGGGISDLAGYAWRGD